MTTGRRQVTLPLGLALVASAGKLHANDQRSILSWSRPGYCDRWPTHLWPGIWLERVGDERTRGINANELARAVAHIASDAKASDVVVLGIEALTPIADYFVICTADNERQLRAIVRDIEEGAAEQGVRRLRIEGAPESGWVLIDFGAVITHVFGKSERDFYSLDKLWSAAQPVLVIQ